MSITFHTGPMGARKTSTLLDLSETLFAENRSVFILVPIGSERTNGTVYTHDGERSCKIDCIASVARDSLLAHCQALLRTMENPRQSNVLIDEMQFFDGKNNNIRIALQLLRSHGVDVHVFGLLKDMRGELWPASVDVLAVASNIVAMHARCSQAGCETPAFETMLRPNVGSPNSVEIIGGMEMFAPMCADHFIATPLASQQS